MKNSIYNLVAVVFSGLAIAVFLPSCSKDVPIGEPIDIDTGYTLPQEGASDEDNARIIDIYDRWGSFVIYRIDPDDIFWQQISGNASTGGRVNKYTEGDPSYVGDMLDYLDEVWWRYFPDDFMKTGGAPYRIYIVEEYYAERDFGGGDIRKYPSDFYIGDNFIVLGGMSTVASLDEATLKSKKIALITALWTEYVSSGVLTTPTEFYTVSDYTTKPEMTYNPSTYSYEYTPEQLDALRNRGFIPNYSQYGYSVYNEIYMKYSETNDTWSSSDPRSNDFNYYIAQILNTTDEEAAEFLKYETVATKWNIILDYYKDNYGIDLRAIATE